MAEDFEVAWYLWITLIERKFSNFKKNTRADRISRLFSRLTNEIVVKIIFGKIHNFIQNIMIEFFLNKLELQNSLDFFCE